MWHTCLEALTRPGNKNGTISRFAATVTTTHERDGQFFCFELRSFPVRAVRTIEKKGLNGTPGVLPGRSGISLLSSEPMQGPEDLEHEMQRRDHEHGKQ